MDDDQTIPPPARIPSAWRALPDLREAMEMLEQNPDLIDNKDIQIALASEAPDAVMFLDAMIAAAHYLEYRVGMDKAYAKMVHERFKDTERLSEKQDEAVIQLMQSLRLKRHDMAAGKAWWSVRKGPVIITGDVPKEYKRHIPEQWVEDKDLIGRALDDGVVVPGATRGNGKLTLTIKP